MSEPTWGGTPQHATPSTQPMVAPTYAGMPPLPAPVAAPGMVAYSPYGGHGPIGKIRSTGLCVLLTIVTFGIYPIVWYYQVHDEMKRHSGDGLGGGIALVLALFVSIVMPFLSASEVGAMYERRGFRRPVSGATGLWYFPGMFLLVGPLIWFIQTNSALNNYWRSLGAR